MSPGRHLLVAGICSIAGVVDVATLATVAPQWWRPSAPSEEARVLEGVSLDVAVEARTAPSPAPGLTPTDGDAPAAPAEPEVLEPTLSAATGTTLSAGDVPARAQAAGHDPLTTVDVSGRELPTSGSPAQPLVTITFASEAIELSAEARATLARVAASPNLGALRVEGHADPSGRAEGNEYFARARARVVARELERLGVPHASLELIGRGASAPLDPSRTAAARARNRRVELWQVAP